MKRLPILLFAILAVINSYGQQITLSGKVIDQETGEGLFAVNVVLLKEFTGVITIETGEFRLSVPQTAKNDSVQFSFIGYGTKRLAVKDMIGQQNIISLPKSAFMLDEAVVVGLPMSAKDYILAAYRHIPDNYFREDKSMLITADYYSFMVENDKCVKYEEAVCSMHIPAINKDTLPPSTLIVHAREDKNVVEQQLMQYYPQKKKNGDTSPADFLCILFQRDYVPAFDQYEVRGELFSSEKEIKSTKFTLEGVVEYNGMELLVISAKQPLAGINTYYYIDKDSYAFVFIEEELVVPKGLFSLVYTGMKLKGNGFVFSNRTQYCKVGDKWDIASKQQNMTYQLTTKRRSSGVELTFNYVVESALVAISREETDQQPYSEEIRYNKDKGSLVEQAQNQDPTFWDTYKPLRPKKFEEALNK